MLRVEIADTPRDVQKGLMFRTKLPEDSGMLFSFADPAKLSFWGRNTYLPLDIAFIDEDHKITQISHIPPLSERPVFSSNDCLMAIEANLGYFDQHRIRPGYKVNIDKFNDRIGAITFHEG